MAGIFGLLMSGAGALKDQYFNLVSLLLPGNGTNGATNNSFVDSSTANSGTGWPITRNGDTTQGTFSPFSQTGWSAYFDGSNDYVSMPDSTAFTMGSGDFTIECWVYKTTSGRQYITGQSDSSASSGSASFELSVNASNKLVGSVTVSTTTYSATSTADFPLNTWKHVAFVRNSGTTRLYIGGEQDGTNATLSTNSINDSANQVAIGRLGEYNGLYWNGYISNFRITKGGCLYPNGTTFTPSITPLTTTVSSGTVSLLTCQNNRFIDNAATPNTITATGGTAITPFSPFAPTSSYSAAAVGGSGYFDGSGDFLNTPSTTALAFNGDWTIEFWYYPLVAYTDGRGLFGFSDDKDNVDLVATNALRYFNGSTSTTFTGVTYTLNAWNHLAFVNASGTVRLYINGVQSTNSHSGVSTTSARTMYILSNILGTTSANAYTSNLRIVKGTAVYTGAFTPPTKPLAASGADSAGSYPSTTNVNTSFAGSATSLLLNFTNAGVVDATAKNDLQTVNNAQISTSVKQFGTGSMYFPQSGTTDYLLTPTSNNYAFGTGDFTIEGWIYITSTGTIRHFYDQRPASTDGAYPTLRMNASNAMEYVTGGSVVITSSALSQSVWHHFALARSGTSTRLFVNGTQGGSTYTDSTNYLCGANRPLIGGSGYHLTTFAFPGYIDDLRVTKGSARGYTGSTITVPTAPFPLQ